MLTSKTFKVYPLPKQQAFPDVKAAASSTTISSLGQQAEIAIFTLQGSDASSGSREPGSMAKASFIKGRTSSRWTVSQDKLPSWSLINIPQWHFLLSETASLDVGALLLSPIENTGSI